MNLQEGFLTIVAQCFLNTWFALRKKQEGVVTYIKRPVMNAVKVKEAKKKDEGKMY